MAAAEDEIAVTGQELVLDRCKPPSGMRARIDVAADPGAEPNQKTRKQGLIRPIHEAACTGIVQRLDRAKDGTGRRFSRVQPMPRWPRTNARPELRQRFQP